MQILKGLARAVLLLSSSCSGNSFLERSGDNLNNHPSLLERVTVVAKSDLIQKRERILALFFSRPSLSVVTLKIDNYHNFTAQKFDELGGMFGYPTASMSYLSPLNQNTNAGYSSLSISNFARTECIRPAEIEHIMTRKADRKIIASDSGDQVSVVWYPIRGETNLGVDIMYSTRDAQCIDTIDLKENT